MTIVPVDASVSLGSITPVLITPSASSSTGAFDKLYAQLDALNGQLINANRSVTQLANGQTENLHQVMIQLEQTRMSFELMMQVRNKVLDAYQEIMRMQV